MAPEWKSVKISKENYDKLEALRKTEKGEVSFDDVISWLIGRTEK